MFVEEVASRFNVPGRIVSIRAHGSGNVNDTYLVVSRTAFSEQRYILQRIRRAVFPNPEIIMTNMRVITDHCHQKIEIEADSADRIWQLPKIIETKDGEDFVSDAEGNLWRAITHIASATSHEKIQGPEHALEAGWALGHFHRMISDIPVGRLGYALPGFHVTPDYLAKMDVAIGTDEGQARLKVSHEARRALSFIEARRAGCHVLETARERGEIVLRPTHGDPKVGNIMMDDDTGKGTCVIDLDTVQPGLVHYDLGDCVRSGCNPAGEDAQELGDVIFDPDLFASIYKGYLANAKDFLTDGDHRYLFDAVSIVPLELGIRFFADYLSGDKYFKTRYPGHNLRRALVQLKLRESIEAREPGIRKILGEY